MSFLPPVCVECKRVMRCKKNAFKVHINDADIWNGDKYECPACKKEVVVGFGQCVHNANYPDMYKHWIKDISLKVESYN